MGIAAARPAVGRSRLDRLFNPIPWCGEAHESRESGGFSGPFGPSGQQIGDVTWATREGRDGVAAGVLGDGEVAVSGRVAVDIELGLGEREDPVLRTPQRAYRRCLMVRSCYRISPDISAPDRRTSC